MAFPVATRKTAFIAGLSLALLTSLLGLLKAHGLSPYDENSPEVFPVVIAYFFITALVFVIDVRNFAPKELKTRIPLVYFPTNKEGVRLLFTVWGRMLMWFFGVVAGAGMLALLASILK